MCLLFLSKEKNLCTEKSFIIFLCVSFYNEKAFLENITGKHSHYSMTYNLSYLKNVWMLIGARIQASAFSLKLIVISFEGGLVLIGMFICVNKYIYTRSFHKNDTTIFWFFTTIKVFKGLLRVKPLFLYNIYFLIRTQFELNGPNQSKTEIRKKES